MSTLIAIDVAILPPAAVSQRAIDVSAALPAHESQGLQLGPDHLPHITLVQQFVRLDALDDVLARADEVLRRSEPLHLRVSGGGKGSNSVWMSIDREPALMQLHEDLLHAMQPYHQGEGGPDAFFEGEARERDVSWVHEYRRASSFAAYRPHVTLGHASVPPFLEPMDFEATTVAACQLGRFCTCRRIIRAWELDAKS